MSTYAPGADPHEPLEVVLRAVTAPGHPEELRGEHVAVAAYLAAPPRRERSLLARVLTVKVLVVGAVAASTGVVLAAAGGVLPLLPILQTEQPAPVVPAHPAEATTSTTSVPAVPPPDGPANQPADPGTTTRTAPSPASDGPCTDCGEREGPSHPHNYVPGKDKDRPNPHDGPSTPSSPPTEPRSTTTTTENGSPPPGPPETPDSPAEGAVSVVPPSDVEHPSPGG
jgi:hypothetical protein